MILKNGDWQGDFDPDHGQFFRYQIKERLPIITRTLLGIHLNLRMAQTTSGPASME